MRFHHAFIPCVALALAGCAQIAQMGRSPAPPPAAAAAPHKALAARAPTPDPAPGTEFAPTKGQILALQNGLAALGYDVGKRDGKWGPATLRALMTFERDSNLNESDHLTAELLDKIRMVAPQEGETAISVHPGDLLVFSDGERKIAEAKRALSWESEAQPQLVAILPSMKGWPAAARAGFDWALSHALDGDGAVKWSSTGVRAQFEIRSFASLTPKEAARIGGDPSGCRRFELRGPGSRYPGIACRDESGSWYIPHSSIQFSRPAAELGTNTETSSINR